MQADTPQTLQQAMKHFSTGDNAFEYLKAVRWPDGKVNCPRCGSTEVSFVSTRKLWTCPKCTTKKQFTLRIGTILEDSAIPYAKWLCAFWLIANAKNGISSYEIGRALGVTQRTGWFMLQRIRLALQNGSIVKMNGVVEVDETFIGAKARNIHYGKRKVTQRGGFAGKTAVQGLLERHSSKGHSTIVTRVVQGTRKHNLVGNVYQLVERGSHVMTDALMSYRELKHTYQHKVIDHAEKYVDGAVHTNGLENFWCLLKRTIKGTYVNVEPFHLFRYLDEQAFRFNERKDTDAGRFVKAMAGIVGRSLTWDKLTGKGEAGECLPA